MVTIKSYTDYSQAQILSKILPDESADMLFVYTTDLEGDEHYDINFRKNQPLFEDDICAWSLAALLSVIPQVKLDSIKQYDKECWRCCAYFASDWHNSDWCDNPVDACVAMIERLHELNLL